MENTILPLTAIHSGSLVTLVSIGGGRGVRLKLVGMGLGVGMRIKVLSSSGSGPCVILAGNRRLALGRGMTKKILVREETGS
jgi:ferrous iron transport protein A